MGRLTNKTVFITGASAGIGEACAVEFAKEGAHLVLTARRKERLDELSSRLKTEYPGSRVLALPLDVTDRSQVNAIAAQVEKETGGVDVLVNNAGLALGLEQLQDLPVADMDRCIDTNVKGVVYLIQALVPHMRQRASGHVINISSIAGIEAYAGGSIYCATKHALNALTRSLRIELADTPLRVSTVSPGLVETEFSQVRFRGDAERAKKVYAGMDPLVAQDIAEIVVFTANRPPHVQIADTLVFPTAQATATIVARQ